VVDKGIQVSRRTFLTCAAAGTAGAALGGLLGCAAALTYPATVVDGQISLSRSKLEQLAGVNKPVVVKAPDLPDPVILIPVDEKNFRAVSAKCTHLGCHVRPAKNFLVCPCHGSTYDLGGEVIRGPAPSALTTYPVEVNGDRIKIILF
jgi:Rieske Fe-S protein